MHNDALSFLGTDINKTLSFDPLSRAETITGKSYKTDKETESIGVALAMIHGQHKKSILESSGDSTLSNKLDRYMEIVKSIGFEIALELPFVVQSLFDKGPVDEKFFIMIHRDKGILLEFDSYCGDRVNGGNFYYCWKPKPDLDKGIRPSILSSGGLESESDSDWRRNPKYYIKGAPEDVYYSGKHDCREAIIHNIKQLSDSGVFLSPWPKNKRRLLWLLHYQDTKDEGYDYEAINKERIEMLPQWARDIINL